mgnify:CR=1 FL=1
MASITYDGQSFVLDGRRIWIVSGGINYARVPRASWADRIQQARASGLNCVETPVIWSRHEARPGQFDFKGENDIRHFIELVGQAGMYCILRPGPFVDCGTDMGGLPPWLLGVPNIRLRTNSQAFLEACSRYITALAQQVRDLQVVSPSPKRGAAAATGGGPVLLIQSEWGWTCGHDAIATGYLGELDRYYREAGLAVPIVNANELWQAVEGEIDTWSGYDGLLSHLRQLGWVRPEQPRLVMDLRIGRERSWGTPAAPARSGQEALRAIAEVLAAGAQYNLTPFAGGTSFGFTAGRSPLAAGAFGTTSADAGAPVSETGEAGPSLGAVRRISTFASRFARVLSHLESRTPQVSLMPGSSGEGGGGGSAGVSVIHCTGAQGSVAFLFGSGEGRAAGGRASSRGDDPALLLQDGSTLPVPMAGERVVWCLLDTRLAGRSQLNYCNMSALAMVGKVFVCFGPEGARAQLSINGSPLEASVPGGGASRLPTVLEHEGMTVVIANHAQLDILHLNDSPIGAPLTGTGTGTGSASAASGNKGVGGEAGVYLGVLGIDPQGKPTPHPNFKAYIHIDADGQSTSHKVPQAAAHGPAKPHKALKVPLGEWGCAPQEMYVDGTGPRFAVIEKPSDLVALGSPTGYGWYRFRSTGGSAKRLRLIFPHSAHRLHLFVDGAEAGIVGVGAGADIEATLALAKGERTLVALAENLGRVAGGSDLGEATGLYGHAWEVKEIKPGKPKLVPSDPVNLLAFRAPLWKVQEDDVTDPARLTWTIAHRSKTPIAMLLPEFGADAAAAGLPGIVLVNGRPFHYFQTGGCGGGGGMLFIDLPALTRGNNEVQITLVQSTKEHAEELGAKVRFFDCVDCATAKGEWAFARWERPAPSAFEPAPPKGGRKGGVPCWWRSMFTAPQEDNVGAGLLFDAAGLSKGQLYVNGHHIGRYWTATGTGKGVGPQTKLFVPRSMLSLGEPNEVYVFEEHGHSPSRCRLTGAEGGVWGSVSAAVPVSGG